MNAPLASLSRRAWLGMATRGAAAAAIGPALSWGQAPRARPNVILILADDLGSVDLGCYGAADLATPNLDALAARGLAFSEFYTAAPHCTASRAGLLTGRYPARALRPTGGLDPAQVTLAEVLRAAGYRTALFGKWHLGHAAEVSPRAQGFERFVGFKVGVIDNWSHYYYWGQAARRDLWRDDQPYAEDGAYFPDIMTREAVDFVKEGGNRPFFLYLPFNLPHYPMQPPDRTLARFAGIADAKRRYYAACVAAMDERIGRVLGAVREQGLERDTVVVFLSDHGHSTEKDAMGGGGSAGPFRGEKMTLWEGGLRVPCIVSWPGQVPAGRRRQPAISLDWFPTLVGWCQAPLLDLQVDGKPLDDIIASPMSPSPHPALFWSWERATAVREGPWKLVVDGAGAVHLANLAEDPGETRNLAPTRQDVVRRLEGRRQEWLRHLQKA